MEFKSSLKKYRIKNNLTQDDLGKKLGISGKVVSKWESGYNMPDIEKIKLLCEIFDCEYADLIGPEKKNKPNIKVKKESIKESAKETVNLNISKDDSKVLKCITKIAYILVKITKIAFYVLIPLIVIGMIMAPSIISRIKIEETRITYKDLKGDIISVMREDNSLKANYIVKYNDKVIDYDMNFDIIKRINDLMENTTSGKIITNVEVFLVLLLISICISIIALYNFELFLKNVHESDTPFNKNNIHYLAMVSCLMIAICFCDFIISLFLDFSFQKSDQAFSALLTASIFICIESGVSGSGKI